MIINALLRVARWLSASHDDVRAQAERPDMPFMRCYVPCTVRSVHDGDTFKCDVAVPVVDVVMPGVTVRCAGYDAWEITRARRTVTIVDDELARGVAARDALRDLLSGGQVYVSPGDRSGAYDRLGLRVYVLRRDGELVDVAAYMMAGGHCRPAV